MKSAILAFAVLFALSTFAAEKPDKAPAPAPLPPGHVEEIPLNGPGKQFGTVNTKTGKLTILKGASHELVVNGLWEMVKRESDQTRQFSDALTACRADLERAKTEKKKD